MNIAMSDTTLAINPSSCLNDTLPTNIIMNTTSAMSAAVEKFSGNTSPISMALVIITYLNAFFATPSGVCS